MPLNAERVRQRLVDFALEPLFIEELGWDRYPGGLDVAVDGQMFALKGIAEKRGMVAFVAALERLPEPATRRKIEQAVAHSIHEHLIIYTDEARTEQVWQWARREPGRPTATREHVYRSGQTGEGLIQKLDALSFGLDEEAGLTIVDVTQRVRAGFDVERVTRRFYERFQNEHDAFRTFISGLRRQEEAEWYASIMLNRLMFVYFIQKKGLLDADRDYLRNRLRGMQEEHGKDKFLTFYRHFLLRLFHEGLGQRARTAELDRLLGKVPYLNGGLFDVHALEHENPEIHIPDGAFERLFDFFDAYQWHLDDRVLRNDNEINPDVLGYVFERYVNRKEKGAYYTKEDVTCYMTSASVIPSYFDQLVARHPEVLAQLRNQLSADPERYIFPALAHGLSEDGETSALRGEDPRVADYRRHWRDNLIERILNGSITAVDDLVTLNLDLSLLAQDHVDTVDDPAVLATAYATLTSLSILDPTCGSGAFLFAALNIVEPLYESVIERMRSLFEDVEAADDAESFRSIVAEVDRHPNAAYFITKSIIANNLYGVDLLKEACEICKLRLFLRLVSTVETQTDLEPLPDIDFNIRAGNTLVGFATEASARDLVTTSGQGVLDVGHRLDQVVAKAEAAGEAFGAFRDAQRSPGEGDDAIKRTKRDLSTKLEELRGELDSMLVPDTWSGSVADWSESRQPFHWFAEFYDLMRDGGFDVVIGNPPYVARKKIDYELNGFRTGGAPDIYANVLERSLQLIRDGGRIAMIVPLSITFSRDFASLRRVVAEDCSVNWFSSFGRIPDVLFSDDVRVRNTIQIGRRGRGPARTYTTQLHRWLTEYRPYLFETLRYASCRTEPYGGLIPKVNTERLGQAFERLLERGRAVGEDLALRRAGERLYFKQTAYNWLAFSLDEPPCFDGAGNRIPQSKVGYSAFTDAQSRDLAFLLLNGKLMFAWWRMIGDDFDVTETSFKTFPCRLSQLDEQASKELLRFVDPLVDLMNRNVTYKLNAGKRVGTYNLARCRFVTDQTDRVFARALEIEDVLDDIELVYAETVKTGFETEA